MIRKFCDDYCCLLKPFKCCKNDSNYCANITSFFWKHNNKLFDIAAYKCNWSECKCSKDRKVPTEEREFLSDQTILGYTVIAGVDHAACSRRKRSQQRTENFQSFMRKHMNPYALCKCKVSCRKGIRWRKTCIWFLITTPSMKTAMTVTSRSQSSCSIVNPPNMSNRFEENYQF